MKKLVCLLIVLAVVSFASAASVKFDAAGAVAGQVSAAQGAEVVVSIIADFDVANLVVTIGADGGTAKELGVLHPAFKTMPNNGILRNSGHILIERISGSQGVQYGDGPVPAGESLYTFTFVAPTTEGLYTIDFITGPTPFPPPPVPYTCTIDGVGGAISLSSIESLIVVVPEPMTIALLGLGGLFIRRRK